VRIRNLGTGEEREVVAGLLEPGVVARRIGDVAWISFGGETYRLTAARPRKASRGAEEMPSLEAPMPGRIISVRASAGAAVAKGDVLVVLEAMKMEHAVRAPKDGTVTRVLVAEGQMVGLGDVLVEMS
jgi:3-methylcrotonyl-CoA carboxylase alpha subunit